jgi:small multidrug resistance pump
MEMTSMKEVRKVNCRTMQAWPVPPGFQSMSQVRHSYVIPAQRAVPAKHITARVSHAEPFMTSAFNAYAALALAIVFEVTASALLQQSAQFTRPWPTLAMVLCYVASFYALSVAIRIIPLSIAYAIWGGVGIILTVTVSFVLFRQMLDAAAFVGIGLIVSGVVVINLFSETTVH